MVFAFLLIRVSSGKNVEVLEKIRKLSSVKEVTSTYGEYDMLVKVEVDSLKELDSFVYKKVRTILGIETTTTMVAAHLDRK